MRYLAALAAFAGLLGACSDDDDPVGTLPEVTLAGVWLSYNCPDGREVRISDEGWWYALDTEVHPDPNTAGPWSVDELMAAAC